MGQKAAPVQVARARDKSAVVVMERREREIHDVNSWAFFFSSMCYIYDDDDMIYDSLSCFTANGI